MAWRVLLCYIIYLYRKDLERVTLLELIVLLEIRVKKNLETNRKFYMRSSTYKIQCFFPEVLSCPYAHSVASELEADYI